MKEKIHPAYHADVLVHCACGETFRTSSTRKEIRVEICSKCHPFFTGKQKLVDSAGRVDRFNTRYARRDQTKDVKPKTKAASAPQPAKEPKAPKAPKPPKPAAAKADDAPRTDA